MPSVLTSTTVRPGLGPEVELYQNAEWGFRQRDKAVRGMHYFDGVLRKQAFIAGDTFSMADITVIGGLIFAGLVDLQVPPRMHRAACLARAYARAQQCAELADVVIELNG